ncbi:hypothetical protein JOQ06_008393 [Pogonophryne albipinna]|uniref:Uncharacterized protein n=1 Tax=Pogonophryne albipinna TaxID=1090488 RepID=A0AAD6AIU5_9TELE|nr:hypothetical protein JOQ06_008393 [Pogonophryne albipinna]
MPTLSPPTVTESGSSAADSGWRISVMGFCPELARALGAPTLILREAGGRVRVSGVAMLHPLVGHNCQLTPTAQLRKLNNTNPDVNM